MEEIRPVDGLRCLVTGSAGFVGSNLVRALLERGCEVHGFDRAPATFEDPKLRWFRGDIRNRDALSEAMKGVDTVFHTAAMIETLTYTPRPFAEQVRSVNIEGTRSVLQTARDSGVRRLVHTSSIITVFGDGHSGVDETAPYSTASDLYSSTKVASEQLVLAANGESGMFTCALRPGGIYGPGERNTLIGPMIKALKQGVPIVVFGDGATRMDYTYIDNLVDAQIRAAERLVEGSPVCGEAYFVTDGDPINTGDFSQTLVGQMGLDARTLRVPGRLARAIATAGERVFQLLGKPKPPVSIVDVELCVHDSYFSIDSARRDLGY
ncbi:MAG TPA: NAD-dependent epimerase/dehydratase family protein, partial [Polyangiales bacterium]|nr:NAD-dependent epimerase/dehydratase family protein [Polyangiales bacterium]